MVKNSKFFRTFGPPCRNPCQSGWLYARMWAGLCPTYATALGDANENRNGRHWVAIGVSRKTGITSLTFWLIL